MLEYAAAEVASASALRHVSMDEGPMSAALKAAAVVGEAGQV